MPHLKARDTTLMLSSRAPLDKLQVYRKRMGWDIDWASAETDFHRDIGFFNTEEELKPFLESGEIPLTVTQIAEMCGTDAAGYVAEGPGLSVYALDDGTVYRTYVSTSRGLEVPAMAYYRLLDRTPEGRNEPPGPASLGPPPRRVLGRESRLATVKAGRRTRRPIWLLATEVHSGTET